MQPVRNLRAVVAAIDLELARLTLPTDRNEHLPCRKGCAFFGVDFELLILNLLDLADFDALLKFQLAFGNGFFHDLNKVIAIKITVDIQFANVFDCLGFGVNLLALRERPNGACQFSSFEHDVLYASFFAFDGG